MIIQQIIPTSRSIERGFIPNFASLIPGLTRTIQCFSLNDVEERLTTPAIQVQFSEMYEKHVKRIYTFHFLKTGNIHDAEDLTSQTFLEAFEGLSHYTEEGRFLAWIYSIARKKNADFYRRKRTWLPLFILEKTQEKTGNPEATIQSKIQMERIMEGLKRIGDEKAEAVILRIFCQVDAEETGQIMGKSAAAIRMMVYRGLKELRSLLQDEIKENK